MVVDHRDYSGAELRRKKRSPVIDRKSVEPYEDVEINLQILEKAALLYTSQELRNICSVL